MSAHHHRHHPTLRLAALFGWALLGLAAPGGAAVFRVGNDGIPPCTHTTLAAAIAAAAANGSGIDQIYLSDPLTLSSPADINNHSVEIAGGFSDCNDNTPSGRTSVTMSTSPGFWVHGGSAPRSVSLVHLSVIRGAGGGRILDLESPAIVALYDTLLSNGQADNGANVRMIGASAILFVSDGSSISSGDATGVGGGVYCSDSGTVVLDDGSISSNTALDGGGLYLDNCTLNAFAGTTGELTCPAGIGSQGILCNDATDQGGGIYAANGSSVNLIGGAATPATLAENDADYGGGLYLTGAGTTAEASNSEIRNNNGFREGGGIYVRFGASFSMWADEPDCSRGPRCSLLQSNFSSIIGGQGGALAVDTGGDATIQKTTITGNYAITLGAALFVEGAGSTVAMEGNFIFGNSGNPNDAFLETDDQAVLTVGFSTINEATGSVKGLFDTNNGSTVNVYSSILVAARIFDDAIGAGESRFADCILYNETTSTLPPPPDLFSYEAILGPASGLFANLGAGDYRLRANSQAVDFCDTFHYTPQTTDIEQQARGFDVPSVPNSPYGPYDLGADEWQWILVADHEEGNCSDWSSNTGGC